VSVTQKTSTFDIFDALTADPAKRCVKTRFFRPFVSFDPSHDRGSEGR